jgi:hypothetical protein
MAKLKKATEIGVDAANASKLVIDNFSSGLGLNTGAYAANNITTRITAKSNSGAPLSGVLGLASDSGMIEFGNGGIGLAYNSGGVIISSGWGLREFATPIQMGGVAIGNLAGSDVLAGSAKVGNVFIGDSLTSGRSITDTLNGGFVGHPVSGSILIGNNICTSNGTSGFSTTALGTVVGNILIGVNIGTGGMGEVTGTIDTGCIFIGSMIESAKVDLKNSVVIGDGAYCSTDNTIVLGRGQDNASGLTPHNVVIGAFGSASASRLQVTGDMELMQSTNAYKVNNLKVVGSRRTGWAASTGTATRTTFATTTVTLPQLAERVKALLDDLTTHGLIGA